MRRSVISDLIASGDPSIYVEMFSSLMEAIIVRDPNGEVVHANPAALNSFGYTSLEQLRARPASQLFSRYLIEDERGHALSHDDLPGVRLARERKPGPPVLMRVIAKDTGEQRWWRTTTTPLHGADGEFLGAMSAIEDVTAVHTAEIHTRALAESGRILASSLDYAQTLRNVAQVAVLLADYCSVDLIDDRRMMRRAAAAHVSAERRPVMRQMAALAPTALADEHPVMRVLNSGEPELYELMTDADIAEVARDPDHLELLRALGPRSMLIVPLRVPSRTIGVMTMATDVSRRRLTDGDVSLAEQLGRRAAVAVENSRLHTKLAGIAETLQTGLLPAPLPHIPGWDLAALYQPAATEFRVDVGGDFYEVFQVPDGWIVILGDVTGKGVGAASVTALMRHGARVAARIYPEPAEILRRLDEALAEQPNRAMATAVCMKLDANNVVISSAGHPPAVVVAADGRLREVPVPDPMLGAFDGIQRNQHTIGIGVGDLIVAYTDGVPDAPNATERFGMDRLRRTLSSVGGQEPQRALDRICAEMTAFGAEASGDDAAAIALRRA